VICSFIMVVTICLRQDAVCAELRSGDAIRITDFMTSTIAIVADFNCASKSHLATNDAIAHCASALGKPIEPQWISTAALAAPDGLKRLEGFRGIWIGPGSPYQSMEGALSAIRMARERGIPLLGTCGGFQHIILEYARNVLGFTDADHEESSPQASRLFISRLACSLAGREMTITLEPDSMLGRIYGRKSVQGEYLCNFGVNPEYVPTLRKSALKVVASDTEGEIRAVELEGHPFFLGTLFLPQHRSTPAQPHPLVTAFVRCVVC
jgi:CTP synthase (UTP-ammonia lyase)